MTSQNSKYYHVPFGNDANFVNHSGVAAMKIPQIFKYFSPTLARLARHRSAFTSMCGTDTAGRGALEPPPEGGARTKLYSTVNSSSANRILRPRQKNSWPNKYMTPRNDLMYQYTRQSFWVKWRVMRYWWETVFSMAKPTNAKVVGTPINFFLQYFFIMRELMRFFCRISRYSFFGQDKQLLVLQDAEKWKSNSLNTRTLSTLGNARYSVFEGGALRPKNYPKSSDPDVDYSKTTARGVNFAG